VRSDDPDDNDAAAPLPDEKMARLPPVRLPPGVVGAAEWPPSMRYAIVTRYAIVGYTNLEFPIEWHRRAAGFMKTDAGFATVQRVFRLYWEERLERYVAERDALGLTLQDGGTLPMAARIELISQWPDGRIVVHVAIEDERYWRRIARPRDVN